MRSDGVTTSDPVVISGMAVEAPGGIDSPGALWSALAESRELIGPFPRDRGWTVEDLLSTSRVAEGWRQVCDAGGFLDGAGTVSYTHLDVYKRQASAHPLSASKVFRCHSA